MRHRSFVKKTATILGLATLGTTCAAGISEAQRVGRGPAPAPPMNAPRPGGQFVVPNQGFVPPASVFPTLPGTPLPAPLPVGGLRGFALGANFGNGPILRIVPLPGGMVPPGLNLPPTSFLPNAGIGNGTGGLGARGIHQLGAGNGPILRIVPFPGGAVPPGVTLPPAGFNQPINGGLGTGLGGDRQISAVPPVLPGQLGTTPGSALPVTPGFTSPNFVVPFAPTVLPGAGMATGGVPNAGTALGPLQAARRGVTAIPGAVTTAPRSSGSAGRTAAQGRSAPAQGAMTAQPAATGMAAVRTSNSRRTRVRGAMDVATAQRFNMARSQGALRQAEVVRTTPGYVWVRIQTEGTGTPALRRIASSNVFFYRAGEMLDGATFPSMAQPGESVMIVDSSRTPL